MVSSPTAHKVSFPSLIFVRSHPTTSKYGTGRTRTREQESISMSFVNHPPSFDLAATSGVPSRRQLAFPNRWFRRPPFLSFLFFLRTFFDEVVFENLPFLSCGPSLLISHVHRFALVAFVGHDAHDASAPFRSSSIPFRREDERDVIRV